MSKIPVRVALPFGELQRVGHHSQFLFFFNLLTQFTGYCEINEIYFKETLQKGKLSNALLEKKGPAL